MKDHLYDMSITVHTHIRTQTRTRNAYAHITHITNSVYGCVS